MILILPRYITTTILKATFLVILVVTGLVFFITLLAELRDIAGDYNFTQAAIYSLLRLPYNLYQFFPMLVLVGSMMGLGLLSTNRELIVMRTSGFSIFQLVKGILLAAFILIFISTFLGEYLGPHANYIANKHKDSAQSNGQAVSTASGVWIHEGNNFLHIDKVNGLSHLEGVTRYEFDEQHHLLATYYAQYIDYENKQWKLRGEMKTTFANDLTHSEQLKQDVWDFTLSPNLLSIGVIQPEEMSLARLAHYSQHLIDNKLQSNEFQFEFWKRIFQPFMTIVMILLAVPFVFGSPRSVTMGLRILLGVMIGFAFYILNALFGQFAAVYQFPPFMAALLPTLFFALIGCFFLLRI